MKKLNKIIFALLQAIILVAFSAVSVTAQESNTISYGFDKVLNTYLFKLGGVYNQSGDFGTFQFRQNYSGTSITSIGSYFRDDEILNLAYKYPVTNTIDFGINSNYLLNSDSKSSGINELQRINGIASAGVKLFDVVSLKAGYGVEDNTQSGIQSTGSIINFAGSMDNLDLDGYTIRASGDYESLKLNNDRNQLDFQLSSEMFKSFDESNSLAIRVNYKKQGRDYLQSANRLIPALSVESRLEDRISAALDMNFSLSDNLLSNLNLTFENAEIERDFKSIVESNNYSFIKRELSERNFGLMGNGHYQTGIFNQKLGFTVQFRNESNFIRNKFDLAKNEFDRLLNIEKQRDNQSTITRVFSKSSINITKHDTLSLDLSLGLNRYDTPSNDNNDDRDELSNVFGLSYSRFFSPVLRVKVTADLIGTHLVFIKSQRSALNNWNRVIRLVPSIEYNYGGVSFKPKLEILANYTTYDFEEESGNTRSYSFRQVSYSDSIKVGIASDYSIESRIYSRYYERGILYWNNFSETPQTANLELFANILFFMINENGTKIGIGGRYYKLKQYTLPKSGLPAKLNYFDQFSFGPEINIYFQLRGYSNVIVKGWYDFRTINKIEHQPLGNLILQTNLTL